MILTHSGYSHGNTTDYHSRNALKGSVLRDSHFVIILIQQHDTIPQFSVEKGFNFIPNW